MNNHPLLEFIRERPAIAPSKLGISPSMMSLYLSGKKNFPDDSVLVWKLTWALCDYGLQIDKWRFRKSDDGDGIPLILAEIYAEGEELQTKEIEHEGGGVSIVHYVPMYRTLFANQVDLQEFFINNK